MKLVLCEIRTPASAPVESYSPFCLKVHRALKAASLPYDRHQESNPAAFKKHNAMGQVPILLVDDQPIADSTKILRFIVTKSQRALLPSDAHARAEAWLWEEFADGVVSGYLVAARWADERNWDRVHKAYFSDMPWVVQKLVTPMLRRKVCNSLHARDVIRKGMKETWAAFEQLLDTLDARAPREGMWVSPEVSVADLSLFGQLQNFRTDLTSTQSAMVEKREHLRRYLDRVDESTRG
jgi:glutathione S-transferase